MNGDVGQKEGAKLFALFLMISVNDGGSPSKKSNCASIVTFLKLFPSRIEKFNLCEVDTHGTQEESAD